MAAQQKIKTIDIFKPPKDVLKNLEDLEKQLDLSIPEKILDKNLLIATWNIRELSGYTNKWKSNPKKDSPKRDLHALAYLAEVINRFDVVAIQEVGKDVSALKVIIKILGPNWAIMLTDETKGSLGRERIAFLFDTRRLILSGLACQLVLSEDQFKKVTVGDASARKKMQQFARTPYAVGFQCRATGKRFTLVSLHVLYGKKTSDRLIELQLIANWLAEWASDPKAWDNNLIALGDFNITSLRSNTYKTFTATGLYIPEVFKKIKRVLSQKKNANTILYDQIAWFDGSNGVPALDLKFSNCGNFDFSSSALKGRRITKSDLSWYISDHYPLWVEFDLRNF